ncbi:MAG: T9SS type A sorting domain-containing protein [Bacteroidota bacterium]
MEHFSDSSPKNSLGQSVKLKQKNLLSKVAIGMLLLSGLLFTTTSGDGPACAVDGGTDELVPFSCDGSLFLFQKSPTIFSTVEADGSLSAFGVATNCPDGKNITLNGQGFRASDGLIYGLKNQGKTQTDIYRIGADGRVEFYASVNSPPGYEFISYIGEIGGEDLYYFVGKDPSKNRILFTLDLKAVDDALANGDPIPAPVPHSLSKNVGSIHDFAFNPLDGKLYSLQQGKGKVVEIDVNQDPIQVTIYNDNGSGLGAFGAIYFGADGTLYASQNSDGQFSNIYRINLDCPGDDCGQRTLLGSGDKVSQNDGASCTATIPVLTKQISAPFSLPGDTVTYTFTLTNGAVVPASISNFEDVLPPELAGAYWLDGSLSGNTGGGTPSAYGGSNQLMLSSLTIPAKNGNEPGKIEFQLDAVIPDNESFYGQTYESQTFYNHHDDVLHSSDAFLSPGSPTPVSVVRPFTVTKSVVNGQPLAGERLTYEVRISNPNDGGSFDGAYRVSFADTVTANGSFPSVQNISVASTNGDFVYNGSSISSDILSINEMRLFPGDEIVIRYEVDIDPNLPIGESLLTASNTSVPNTSMVVKTQGEVETLPVEYLFFEAENRDGKAYLFWATATELNNDGFEIQHSIDGQNFESMGWVEGFGTTQNMQEYSFQSDPLLSGSHLFRLKQVDFNGQFDFSDRVEIRVEADPVNQFTFGPNPFRGEGNINLMLQESQSVEISMMNMNGATVARIYEGQLQANVPQQIPVQLASQLTNGYYIIQINGSNFRESKKVLLRR